MIRTFIAIELEDKETIQEIFSFSQRLQKNQQKLKLVNPENLHLTLKFLGNIPESLASEVYGILKKEVNENLFQGKPLNYYLKGVGQFNKFSVLWIKMVGDIQFIQKIKDTIEELLFNKLKIEHDKRPKFKPHLTIGRLRKDRINYKNFETFKKIINENKEKEFGKFTIRQIKLKKSQLTPTGPIYTDLVY